MSCVDKSFQKRTIDEPINKDIFRIVERESTIFLCLYQGKVALMNKYQVNCFKQQFYYHTKTFLTKLLLLKNVLTM